MKKLLIAGLALSTLIGAGAASAQPYGREGVARDRFEARQERREDRFERRQDRREYRRWARGQRLPSSYYRGNQYYVSDYGRYGLRAPPRGYRWYRTGNDYVLAAAATGLIASVIAATR